MPTRSRAVAWLAVAAFVLACAPETPEPRGVRAPAFDLERLDGSRVTLEQLRGKTVLIDFWATWCPPCVLEIPELNAVWQETRGSDVEILAISIDTDDTQAIAAWVKEKGVLYPVARADVALAAKFGADQFPFHVLIGPDGSVLENLPPGYHDREELGALISRHTGS